MYEVPWVVNPQQPLKKLTSVKVKHSVHVTPGYICDFARKFVLPLNRYKAQFLWSVIEFCVNIYIFDGRHIAKHLPFSTWISILPL